MLDRRKLEAIELLVDGVETKKDIAEQIGVSRTTLYDWLKDPEFLLELGKSEQAAKHFTQQKINRKKDRLVEIIHEIAESSANDMARLNAAKDLLDRGHGKATSKVQFEEMTQSPGAPQDLLADILGDEDEEEDSEE